MKIGDSFKSWQNSGENEAIVQEGNKKHHDSFGEPWKPSNFEGTFFVTAWKVFNCEDFEKYRD